MEKISIPWKTKRHLGQFFAQKDKTFWRMDTKGGKLGLGGAGGGGVMNWEIGMDIYTLMYKIDN